MCNNWKSPLLWVSVISLLWKIAFNNCEKVCTVSLFWLVNIFVSSNQNTKKPWYHIAQLFLQAYKNCSCSSFFITVSNFIYGCICSVGWEKNSYGFHGDDGHSFCSSGTGKPYGPTFTTGDVIGCGLNLIDNTCFYTKNGVNLGNIKLYWDKSPILTTIVS